MKKFIAILLLFCAQTHFACDCGNYKQIQKKALAENKLMLLYVSNFLSEDDNGNLVVNPGQQRQEMAQLMTGYLLVCANRLQNPAVVRKLGITQFPQLLVVDGNGKVLYRFKNANDEQEFFDTIQNFSFAHDFFTSERQNFNKAPSYHSALRAAQKYFDYSLIVDQRFKSSVFAIGQSYIDEAQKALSKKDKAYAEKSQKINLLQLFHWAYAKNFLLLDQELAAFDSLGVFESNNNLFYFLKYLTAKALQQERFPQIEAMTKSMDGFEAFVKKADIILSSQV